MGEEKRYCMQCMRELNDGEDSCSHCGFGAEIAQTEPGIAMGTVLEERYICGKMIKKNIDSAVYIGYDKQENSIIEVREFLPDKIALRADDTITLIAAEGYEDTYEEYKRSYAQLWKNLMRFRGLPALFNVNYVFNANNTCYAVTDHNDSTTFRKILNNMDLESKPMTLKRVKELIVPMLSTIESLHTASVVHRGISPDTLILTSDGMLKLTGFEIPQVRTTKNELMCSVCDGYAAIEQYGFSWQQGSWTDIYSVGALIYELLTGRTVKRAPERLNDDEIIFTEDERKRIPESITALIKNCLAVMPQDRIKSIAEIRNVIVPFDAPVSNVTRSTAPVREFDGAVRVRTDSRRTAQPQEEEQVKIYTKPKQAKPGTKTSQPKGVVISEKDRLRQIEEAEKEKEEIRKRAEAEEAKRLLQLQEAEKEKQEKKALRKDKIVSSAPVAFLKKVKDKIGEKLGFADNPIFLGVVAAASVVIICIVLTMLLYGTVLYKYVSAPVLDNCLSSFAFLPLNEDKNDEASFYEVPDFTGLTKEVIENESAFLRKFTVAFEYDYCDTVSSGYVFSQSIEPGETAEKGSLITVYISKGIQMITMIDVTSMTGDEAKQKLTEIGFSVSIKTLNNNGFRKEGKIVSVSLTPGNTYPKGSEVELEVWGAPVWETLPSSQESTTGQSGGTTSENNNNNNNENPFGIPSIFDWIFGNRGW